MELKEIIPEASLETYDTEFKQILSEHSKDKDSSWLKTVSAFANNRGGYLYIGVKDKNQILYPLTQTLVDQQCLLFYREIEQRLSFPIKTEIKPYPIIVSNKTLYVIEIHVYPSLKKPIAIKSNGANLIYTHDFGRTRSASIDEITAMVLQSENISFDSQITKEIYDPNNFSHLRNRYSESNNGKILTEKALISIGFMNEQKELTKGALLFGNSYSSNLTKIVAVKWPGIDKGSDIYQAKEEFCGNLIDSIEFGKTFIDCK